MKTYKDLFTALHNSIKKSDAPYLSPLAENDRMMWFHAEQRETVPVGDLLGEVYTKFYYTWMKDGSKYEIKADRGFNHEIIATPDMEPVLEIVNDTDRNLNK